MGKTIFKLSEEQKQQLVSMANEGFMDSEIANTIGNITANTVYYWRKKLGIKSKFNYSKIAKIDNAKFEELFNMGLSDYKIAEELNMSPDGIYAHRMRHKYYRETDLRFNTATPITDFQKQVLLGTLLGDASLRGNTNYGVTCAHGLKQKEYCEYKTSLFESIGATCKYHKRTMPDKRTGIYYEDYTMRIPYNPELNSWYKEFYPNGKKVIPMNLVEQYFTEVSLAFMFMDDGCKTSSGYRIATMCFTTDELNQFKLIIENKLGLSFTIYKDNSIYFPIKYQVAFTQMIKKHIPKSMQYKLHTVS